MIEKGYAWWLRHCTTHRRPHTCIPIPGPWISLDSRAEKDWTTHFQISDFERFNHWIASNRCFDVHSFLFQGLPGPCEAAPTSDLEEALSLLLFNHLDMSLYLLVLFVLAPLFCLSESFKTTEAEPNLQSVLEVIKTTQVALPSHNVCGMKCETECIFSPQGGHMLEVNDCYVIADTIRFFSENNGKTNILGMSVSGTPPNNVTMVYSTCKSIFLNQGTVPLEYCRKDWSKTIEYMVPFCHGWQHAKSSKCVAQDQSWSVEVQHS